jgi:hypothetical protein
MNTLSDHLLHMQGGHDQLPALGLLVGGVEGVPDEQAPLRKPVTAVQMVLLNLKKTVFK